jgi:hypothetical protein
MVIMFSFLKWLPIVLHRVYCVNLAYPKVGGTSLALSLLEVGPLPQGLWHLPKGGKAPHIFFYLEIRG